MENLQELAMASQPVDLELKLTKKPQNRLSFNENSQPFGPSAPLENFSTNTVTVDQRIEKAYYDRDQKSSDGIVELYKKGVLVFYCQQNGNLNGLKLGSKTQLGICGERNHILLAITKRIMAEKNTLESAAVIIQHA